MKQIAFTNGLRVNLDQVTSILVQESAIMFNTINNSSTTVYVLDVDSVMKQIDEFVNSGAGHLELVDGGATTTNSLVFTSIAPNSVLAADDSYVLTLTGSDFITLCLNGAVSASFKLDDGGGQVLISGNDPFPPTNTIIGLYFANPPHTPATYTLYYSTDGGNTWTTTGLTVTLN